MIFLKKHIDGLQLNRYCLSVMKNKIVLSNYGNGIAVGLYGEPSFIEYQFNMFFNYGGVSPRGELHQLHENFAYFLSSEEDLAKAISLQQFTQMIVSKESRRFKGNPKGMQEMCDAIGKSAVEQMHRENFMLGVCSGGIEIRNVAQNGRAEKWEEE